MSPEHLRWVEELCRSELERDPAERPGFLADACHGEQELRREVELLIHSSATEGCTNAALASA